MNEKDYIEAVAKKVGSRCPARQLLLPESILNMYKSTIHSRLNIATTNGLVLLLYT